MIHLFIKGPILVFLKIFLVSGRNFIDDETTRWSLRLRPRSKRLRLRSRLAQVSAWRPSSPPSARLPCPAWPVSWFFLSFAPLCTSSNTPDRFCLGAVFVFFSLAP